VGSVCSEGLGPFSVPCEWTAGLVCHDNTAEVWKCEGCWFRYAERLIRRQFPAVGLSSESCQTIFRLPFQAVCLRRWPYTPTDI